MNTDKTYPLPRSKSTHCLECYRRSFVNYGVPFFYSNLCNRCNEHKYKMRKNEQQFKKMKWKW